MEAEDRSQEVVAAIERALSLAASRYESIPETVGRLGRVLPAGIAEDQL